MNRTLLLVVFATLLFGLLSGLVFHVQPLVEWTLPSVVSLILVLAYLWARGHLKPWGRRCLAAASVLACIGVSLLQIALPGKLMEMLTHGMMCGIILLFVIITSGKLQQN